MQNQNWETKLDQLPKFLSVGLYDFIQKMQQKLEEFMLKRIDFLNQTFTKENCKSELVADKIFQKMEKANENCLAQADEIFAQLWQTDLLHMLVEKEEEDVRQKGEIIEKMENEINKWKEGQEQILKPFSPTKENEINPRQLIPNLSKSKVLERESLLQVLEEVESEFEDELFKKDGDLGSIGVTRAPTTILDKNDIGMLSPEAPHKELFLEFDHNEDFMRLDSHHEGSEGSPLHKDPLTKYLTQANSQGSYWQEERLQPVKSVGKSGLKKRSWIFQF